MDINIMMDKEIRNLIGRAKKYHGRFNSRKSFFSTFGGDIIKKSMTRNKWNSKGVQIPPFLIASISSDCNLNCSGCYARAEGGCIGKESLPELNAGEWSRIFGEADELGVSFILLAGGEPGMRPDVIKKASEHKNIIFPIFTNGTLMSDEDIELYSENGHLIPVISMEGDEDQTDHRRGDGVSDLINDTVSRLNDSNIMFGASVTLTKENYDMVSSAKYVDDLYMRGCGAIIFVEYIPMDGQSDHLVLDEHDMKLLDSRAKELKEKYEDMIVISFPGDEEMMGGCLAAGRGFFHISPGGEAEPCPFSPYSKLNLKETGILDVLKSDFFEELRTITKDKHDHYGGCTLYNERASVKELISG